MPRTFKSENPLIDNALQAMYDTLFNPDDAPEEHEYLEDVRDLAPLLEAEERDAVWLALETVLTVLHFQNPDRHQLETLDILTLLLRAFNCSLYPLAMGDPRINDEPETIEALEGEEWTEIAELDSLTEATTRNRERSDRERAANLT